MRVLVVEDEARMARLLRRALEEEGHAVDTAGDGPEGLWLATENHYAAIILDVMLPGVDGIEVCLRLGRGGVGAGAHAHRSRPGRRPGPRARRGRGRLPGQALQPAGAGGPAAGPGPARRPGRPAVLAVGDLRLDPARKQAWRDSTELRLSPREFCLLEFFLRHPGTVLTRSQIIEAVWDFAYDGGSNVVDQYVNYLRRKVDAPFGRADIETVRGMGYRLRDSPQEA